MYFSNQIGVVFLDKIQQVAKRLGRKGIGRKFGACFVDFLGKECVEYVMNVGLFAAIDRFQSRGFVGDMGGGVDTRFQEYTVYGDMR
jgi:hypothetical protein